MASRIALSERTASRTSSVFPSASRSSIAITLPPFRTALWTGQGCDHGYDVEVFHLGLALNPDCFASFVEGGLERIGEDDPDFVLEAIKGGVEVRVGRPRP